MNIVNPYRRLATSLLLFYVINGSAFADSFEINGSQSPDGKFYMTMKPSSSEDTGGAAGTVSIRKAGSNEVMRSFDWVGFGVRPDADCFKTVWRKDDKAFAIWYELTRGAVVFDVYVLTGNHLKKVELPDLYRGISDKYRNNVVEGMAGKGGEIPQAWFGHGRILIKSAYRSITEIGAPPGDTEQVFATVLQIQCSADSPKASIVNITLSKW